MAVGALVARAGRPSPAPVSPGPASLGPAIVLARLDGTAARSVAHELGALHLAAYVGTPEETDPFYSAERFAERLTGYASSPAFALVTARAGEDGPLIGYAFGYVLPPGARWWDGLLDPVPAGLTTETGRRTFAVCELHVDAAWRGRGLASLLHRTLLPGDPERATLLVRQDNPARAVYAHWGYEYVGRLQPYPDAPVYAALLLPLDR